MLNTSTGVTQPGAMHVRWSLLAKQTRAQSQQECIPDPPIQPSFSQSDLAVVQFHFHQLCQLYPTVLEIGFFNALGKILFFTQFFTGSQFSAMYVKGTNAFLKRVAISSLPFAIDDPPQSRIGSALDINNPIVDLCNSCKTANLRQGSSCFNSV